MYIYICYICADGDDNIICWQYVLTRVVSSPPYQPLADQRSSLTPPKKVISPRYQAFFHPGVYSPRVSISIANFKPRDWDIPNSMWSTVCHQQLTQTTFWTCDGLNLSTSWQILPTLAFKSFTERFVVRRELPFRFRPWFRKVATCFMGILHGSPFQFFTGLLQGVHWTASLRSPVKLERLDESLFKTFLVPHDMKSKLAQLGQVWSSVSLDPWYQGLSIHRIHRIHRGQSHECHESHGNEPWGHEDLGK